MWQRLYIHNWAGLGVAEEMDQLGMFTRLCALLLFEVVFPSAGVKVQLLIFF